MELHALHHGGAVRHVHRGHLLGIISRIPPLTCRMILAKGQKPVRVYGPFQEAAEEVAEIHKGYWN